MKNKAFSKIGILIILIILIGGGYLGWQYWQTPSETIPSEETTLSETPETRAQIQSLEITPSQQSEEGIVYQEGAKAVATGKELSKVEFRQRGGGQIYTSPEGGLIGTGIKTEVKDGEEKWESLQLPTERLLSEFCAIGFDSEGNKVGEVCLFNVYGQALE